MISNFNEFDHQYFMNEALKEAKEAGIRGDRPVGAVITHNGIIIAKGSNMIETLENNISHAEVNAINDGASYLKKNARECIIYTTVEPCVMCLSTIVMANIRNVVFAVEDNYMNMLPFINSNPYIAKRLHNYLGGVLREESINVIKTFSPSMAELILNG